MKNYFIGLLLFFALGCFAQTVERPRISESVMIGQGENVVALQSLLTDNKTMVLLIEPSHAKSAAWLEQLRNSKNERVKSNTLVILSYSPNQKPIVDSLIEASPGLRIAKDSGFAAARGMKLGAFPVILGIQGRGNIAWQHAGDPPAGRSVVDFVEAWVK